VAIKASCQLLWLKKLPASIRASRPQERRKNHYKYKDSSPHCAVGPDSSPALSQPFTGGLPRRRCASPTRGLDSRSSPLPCGRSPPLACHFASPFGDGDPFGQGQTVAPARHCEPHGPRPVPSPFPSRVRSLGLDRGCQPRSVANCLYNMFTHHLAKLSRHYGLLSSQPHCFSVWLEKAATALTWLKK
jgi:hypothetical protein